MTLIVDLRNRMPPVGNQGLRPTCVAFALTSCHEFVYKLSPDELSKDSLHWRCVCLQGSAGNGVLIHIAISALNQYGQHLEKDWPYISHLDEQEWQSLQPPNLNGKPVFKIESAIKVRITKPNALANLLNERGPIFLVLPVWESFFLPNNGQISMPDINKEEYRGLHAVSVVGLTKIGRAIIRNSWGTSWGSFGYGFIPFEYLKHYAINSYFVIS